MPLANRSGVTTLLATLSSLLRSRLVELRHDLVGEAPHRALDFGPRQHRALIEPADDRRDPERLPPRLQAVDALGRIAEHPLVATELLVREIRDGLADRRQARQIVAGRVPKLREDG